MLTAAFRKEENVLAFNLDKCCHLVSRLVLVPAGQCSSIILLSQIRLQGHVLSKHQRFSENGQNQYSDDTRQTEKKQELLYDATEIKYQRAQ